MSEARKLPRSKSQRLTGTFIGAIATVLAATITAAVTWQIADSQKTTAVKEHEIELAAELAKFPGVVSAIVELQNGPAPNYRLPPTFLKALTDSSQANHRRQPISLNRESVRRFSDLGWRLFLLGANDQALQVQRDCENMIRSAPLRQQYDDIAAVVYTRLGQILRKLNKDGEALTYLSMACSAYARTKDCQPQTVAAVIMAQPVTRLKSNRPGDLERLAEVLNDIALVHRTNREPIATRRDFSAAIRYYELSDAIATQLEPGSSGREQHAWNQNGLGIIAVRQFSDTGNRDYLVKARKHFELAESVFREETGSHPRAAALNHLALVDYLEEKYESAGRRLRFVVNIWKDELGPLSQDVEFSYKNLRAVHDAMLGISRDKDSKALHQIASANWKAEADTTKAARAQGLDIRLDRQRSVYSSEDKDEWDATAERLRALTRSATIRKP